MSFDGVQATNCDATKCKYSAVKMGYWHDNYIQYFVTGYERKTPEINRGYYARTKGMAMFMDKFLNVNPYRLSISASFSNFFLCVFFCRKPGQTVRLLILALGLTRCIGD